MKYTDIYSNKVTVNEYQDTHSYVSNPKVLERVVKLLSNTINNFLAKENILLYDLGCGSGEIDISLYNYLCETQKYDAMWL